MKNSTKILSGIVAVLSVILFYFLSIGLIYKNEEGQKAPESQYKILQIERFSHIHIDKDVRITINQSDNTEIKYEIENDSIQTSAIEIEYAVVHDTLYIYSIKGNDQNKMIIASTPHLQSIVCNHGKVNLNSCQLNSLNLTVNNGQVQFWEEYTIDNLQIDLSESKLQINRLKSNNINFDLKNSNVNLYNNIAIEEMEVTASHNSHFNGQIKNSANIKCTCDNSRFELRSDQKLNSIHAEAVHKSSLQFDQSLQYSIKSDESSKVNIY